MYKVIRMYPLWTMNVCTEFYGSRDISVWIKVMECHFHPWINTIRPQSDSPILLRSTETNFGIFMDPTIQPFLFGIDGQLHTVIVSSHPW